MRTCVIAVVAATLTMGFVPHDSEQIVVASYYASGETTANGEPFEPLGMTAAHRYLKFGTLLKVERTDTGDSIVVRINDRGPYVEGRSLDLSLGAATALDMVEDGLARVKITILN